MSWRSTKVQNSYLSPSGKGGERGTLNFSWVSSLLNSFKFIQHWFEATRAFEQIVLMVFCFRVQSLNIMTIDRSYIFQKSLLLRGNEIEIISSPGSLSVNHAMQRELHEGRDALLHPKATSEQMYILNSLKTVSTLKKESFFSQFHETGGS